MQVMQVMKRCEHCKERLALLPDGSGIEHIHEAHCPHNEDNHGVEVVLVEETFDGGVYTEVEAIGSLPPGGGGDRRRMILTAVVGCWS